ncbi:MAG: hypothetical protein HXX10_07715 [Rhodoplanes sp.]|uniref:hypothetical protein n=1 Tax=Rhodoplanes sp. TaxID=1968906 RepID=UPI00178D3229|nr:hypothetical protein [Rhodoplanes sp.]NVO13908.1 hypothetical protein [Rhodoplanes sp.]
MTESRARFAASRDPARARRNRIVNGGMMVSQENGSAVGTASGFYPADQWPYVGIHDGAVQVAQVASVTPEGSPNRIRVTVTTADTSIAAGQYAILLQKLEGFNVADFIWGTASAKATILRVGVKAPAGTYGVSIRNNATDRSVVANMVISGGEANTDVVKTLVFTGDTAGTWTKDNTAGMIMTIALAAGSTFQGSLGVQAGSIIATSSQFNFLGTVGNVFELFDVGFYLDPDATGAAPPWELPDYADELRRCLWFWEKTYPRASPPGTATSAGMMGAVAASAGAILGTFVFKSPKRAAPTVTLYGESGTSGVISAVGGGNTAAATASGVTESGFFQITTSGLTAGAVYYTHFKADSRL